MSTFLVYFFITGCIKLLFVIGVSENISSKFIYCWLPFGWAGGWFPKLLKKSKEFELLLFVGLCTFDVELKDPWFWLNPAPHNWLMFVSFFGTGLPDTEPKGSFELNMLLFWTGTLLAMLEDEPKISLLKWDPWTFTE